MTKFSKLPAIGLSLAVLSGVAVAQMKPEDAITFRQSGYKFMAWNMGRIKSNLGGEFNKGEVIHAANAIQAIANSGMGRLYLPGTDKGKGWKETEVKPALFTDHEGVSRVAKAFNEAANEMANVAATGDAAAVKAQFGKLAESCKGCHEKFRKEDH